MSLDLQLREALEYVKEGYSIEVLQVMMKLTLSLLISPSRRRFRH